MNKENQAKYTEAWLRNKGYTPAAAARRVKRSRQHVSEFLKGERKSAPLAAALDKLPPRDYIPREVFR